MIILTGAGLEDAVNLSVEALEFVDIHYSDLNVNI
jgi:hypothetical protein